MQKNEEMLKNAGYGRLILNMCLPTLVIMLVMVIYNMADIYFIGQSGDPDMVAALSLCAPFFPILSGLGTLLGNGGCISISIALGEAKHEKIKNISSFCLLGSLLMGFAFLAIMLCFLTPISGLLGADSGTLSYTRSYLRILSLFAPIIMFNNVFCNLVRADGSAIASMISNLIGTLTNIILDAVFILGFSWGVTGAAAATVIGNTASSVFLLFYIYKKSPFLSLSPKYLCLRRDIILPSITLGLPLSCSTLLMSISSMISNRLMISYGSTAVAAQGVAGKVGMLLNMIAMGICMGLQPAFSYNFGAGNAARLKKLIKNTLLFSFVTGTVLTLLCFAFRNQIIAAFIDNPEVIKNGQVMVIASLLTGPFYGIYQVCQSLMQSTGRTGYATLVSMLDKGIYFLPILLLLKYFFGMYGIAFAGSVTFVFSLITAIFLTVKSCRSVFVSDQS